MVYLDPFEIVNQKVLPSFRKELVKELIKTKSRLEVAKALEITPVAVHYYLKNARGSGFVFNKIELRKIRDIAGQFEKTNNVFVIKTGFKKIVDEMFENRRLCGICGGKECNC